MNGSTNVQVSGIAIFVSMVTLWLAGFFFPELMETAPEMLGEAFVGFLVIVFGVMFKPDTQIKALRGLGAGSNTNSPAIMSVLALILATLMLSGCAGTRAAYKAADGLEETAFVMNQHYLALVSEANDLTDTGALSGLALVDTQDIVRKSHPLLRSLSKSARAYESVRNAETEQELTQAIAAAAVELSNLLNAIRRVSGSTSVLDKIEADLVPLLAAA